LKTNLESKTTNAERDANKCEGNPAASLSHFCSWPCTIHCARWLLKIRSWRLISQPMRMTVIPTTICRVERETIRKNFHAEQIGLLAELTKWHPKILFFVSVDSPEELEGNYVHNNYPPSLNIYFVLPTLKKSQPLHYPLYLSFSKTLPPAPPNSTPTQGEGCVCVCVWGGGGFLCNLVVKFEYWVFFSPI
jgi:hypothetical protein